MDAHALHDLTAAYALDALAGDEEREYEAHLGRCTRCREELGSLRGAAAALAYGVQAPEPPPALRARILEQARSERSNVVPLRRRWLAPGAAALAACFAVGFGVWSLSLAHSLRSEQAAKRRQQTIAQLFADPAARRIALPSGQGFLALRSSGSAALSAPAMERAPAGKTWEAWVIERGKPPIPAGLFPGGHNTAVLLERPVPPGAQVAVTEERGGGAPAPSGHPVLSVQT